ncbi:hypothetical protein DFQ26_000258 [Actinomortierella ambigua]|nr:hypothetical protein DFQ26_000258 [Actinomortierella ambigua]
MAICGHQPGNMRELDINFAFIEDFISRAPEFSRLERIFINEEHVRTDMDVYPAVIRLVKAIQLGGSSLYDCRLEHHRRHHPISPLVIELNSLLPVPRALQGLVESPRPLDRYLSQLEGLHIESTYGSRWLEIEVYYADLPPWRILQCCRELTYLKIDCDLLTDDTNLLAWAAQEARDRAAGKRMPPAVPVEHLWLYATKADPVNALMIVRDALAGFSESLDTVVVRLFRPVKSSLDYGDSDDDEGSSLLGLENSELSKMPNLTNLDWTAPDLDHFDPRLLLICPKLDMLMLTVGNAIPAGRPVQLLSLASHIRLVRLCLKGACVNAFDPSELANMVDLVELVLEQAPENPTPERSLRMNRWTWDWHLPQLWKLEVRCAIEGWFSLRILRTCPRLRNLTIDSTCKQLLEIASVLDDTSGDYFVGVSNLEIFGAWDITPTDLVYLLHRVLPCVQYIRLHKFDSCTALQVVEATRHHPVLQGAHFPENFLSLKERKDIGLCEDYNVAWDCGVRFEFSRTLQQREGSSRSTLCTDDNDSDHRSHQHHHHPPSTAHRGGSNGGVRGSGGIGFKATASTFFPQKSTKPSTVAEEVPLRTKGRVEAQRAYEQELRQKEKLVQEMLAERAREEEHREQQQLRTSRQQTMFHANPIRHYPPIAIHRSDKPLTVPRSPLIGDKRKWRGGERSIEGSGAGGAASSSPLSRFKRSRYEHEQTARHHAHEHRHSEELEREDVMEEEAEDDEEELVTPYRRPMGRKSWLEAKDF